MVGLVGDAPTTSAMSMQRSADELKTQMARTERLELPLRSVKPKTDFQDQADTNFG